MSWWIGMEIDAGGENPIPMLHDVNCTYNLSDMFREALPDLKDGMWGLNNLSGSEAEPHLSKAIKDMDENPDKYKAMNPKNGWGDFDGALEVLVQILSWCQQAPRGTISVH